MCRSKSFQRQSLATIFRDLYTHAQHSTLQFVQVLISPAPSIKTVCIMKHFPWQPQSNVRKQRIEHPRTDAVADGQRHSHVLHFHRAPPASWSGSSGNPHPAQGGAPTFSRTSV